LLRVNHSQTSVKRALTSSLPTQVTSLRHGYDIRFPDMGCSGAGRRFGTGAPPLFRRVACAPRLADAGRAAGGGARFSAPWRAGGRGRHGRGAFMLRPAACSFHEPSARVLAAFTSVPPEEPPGWDEADAKRLTGNAALGREIGKVSHTVNPTSSADRKNTSGNDGTVAGLFPSGNRGLK
jgi:hypothetical protein